MKLTTQVRMGRSETRGYRRDNAPLEVGKNLKFIAERRRDYTNNRGVDFWDIPFADTGKLALTNDDHSFCLPDFAKTMGLSVRELKRLFPTNSIAKVKITIEVGEVEEWEYTK